MNFIDFIQHKNSDGLFSKAFEDFLVYHRFAERVYVSIRDEFSMLCAGGEL